MSRHPGARGRTRSTARVIPARSTPAARRFVADTLRIGHPCRADAVLLTCRLAVALDGPLNVVVTSAAGWVHLIVRPVRPTVGTGSHVTGLRHAVGALERRAARWGLTREHRSTAVWFELHARTGSPRGCEVDPECASGTPSTPAAS